MIKYFFIAAPIFGHSYLIYGKYVKSSLSTANQKVKKNEVKSSQTAISILSQKPMFHRSPLALSSELM
jgi:hypothetical protein